MNKEKILYIVPTLKKDGAEVQIANLISNFKNFEIDIFTCDFYKKGNSIEQNLVDVNIYSKNGFFNIFEINKLINTNNYKIVHSHLPKADFFVGLLKFIKKNFIHIISVHAQYGTRTNESKIKYSAFNIFWKFILNQSDGIIAISNKISNWLIEEHKINLDLITTVHYGVELHDRDEKLSNNKTIGMAARMLPWKGWDRVIDTAVILKEQNVNFNLIFAGSDDINYKNTLIDLVNKKGIQDYVSFHDHYEMIDDFFSKIDLFLFLSDSEGFGLVVLEAIENNTPVICSNIAPLSEFVDNTHGTLVDSKNFKEVANLVKKILEDEDFKKEVQKKQKEKIISEFSIDIASSNYENYYIKLLND
jgi:glycosyltransferase involved in cell wall biosynthesis|tara:strand:+ start:136 stop:1218 length:1083 start_codon:yes stop_codon:yes gene_type:complete